MAVNRMSIAMCWLGLLALVSPSMAEPMPPVWNLPPAEAQMVFLIPNLARFSAKMALLNTELNLDVPGMADAMDEFRRATEMNKGLNEQGALMVVVTDLSQMGVANQPPALLLVPVSNYADFVSNFPGGNPRAATTDMQMPWGQLAHCKQEGEYAVISARQDLLSAYHPGGTATRFSFARDAFTGQTLAKADAVLMLDAKFASAAAEGATKQLGAGVEQFFLLVFPRAIHFVARLGKSSAQLAREGFDSVLENSEVVGVALDIEKEGIGLTLLSQLRTGSKFGPMFADARNADPGLARFPDEPYLMAGTVDVDGFSLGKFTPQFAKGLQDFGVPWYGDKLAAVAGIYQQTRRFSRVYYAPDQLNINSTLASVDVYDAIDARAFTAAFRAYVERLNNHAVNLGQMPGPDGRVSGDSAPVNIAFTTQFTPNALNVDGVQVDQYQIAYNLPPQLMAALGKATGWFIMLTGREQSGYLAAVENKVIVTSTADSPLVRKMITALKNTKGLGVSERIGFTRKHLGPSPVVEGYLSAGDMAQTLNKAIHLMGVKIDPVDLQQKGLAPIGVSLSAESKGAMARLYVPMPTARSGRAPLMHLWRQVFGGEETTENPSPAGNPGPNRPGGPGDRPNERDGPAGRPDLRR